MKKHQILLGFIVAAVALTSCNKDEEVAYYQTIGVLSKSVDSMIIESDDSMRLLVANASEVDASFADNDRVFVYFSLNEGTIPQGIDHVIDIYSMEKLLFKSVIELTADITDSIGNDPMWIQEIWIAKDYLNLNFQLYINNGKHYINLIRFPGEIPVDTINLEIRHNDNGDQENYLTSGFASFDLESLRNTQVDSVVLRITAKEYENRTYEKFITYHYPLN